MFKTYFLKKQNLIFKPKIISLFLLGIFFLVSQKTNAQTIGTITEAGSCTFSADVCDGQVIEFAPTNTTDYTNFQFYFGSVAPANEITGVDAAKNVVYFANDTVKIETPGGTYIMTAEYVDPAGLNCITKNDTIIINYNPTPDLTMINDTLCVADGENIDLATLVTDANTLAGTLTFYTSLAGAQNETGAITQTVSPVSDTKYYVRSETGDGCFDIDSSTVVVRCLSIGNLVWYDNNNNGTVDSGEPGIEDVVVNLYLDADGNGTLAGGELTAITTTTTDGSGQYIFENLKEGKYVVGIPSGEFAVGEPLEYLYSSGTSRANDGTVSETSAPDVNTTTSDTDENGALQVSGDVFSSIVDLIYLGEPTGESPDFSSNPNDNNDNQTVDFGFYGMSIGSFVFLDVNNNGLYATVDDDPSVGATVNLYSQDGATLIATTTTDANGQYLFNNLPEGDYIVGVEQPTGYLSADDIATSTTPSSTDNDDNGTSLVGNEIRSVAFTLDAGTMPTGESDQATTTGAGLGNPAQTDNDLTPDNNSNLHIDFGMKPVCPTIANATGAQTICATDPGTDLTVETSFNGAEQVRWVRFDDAQMSDDMYSGGTDLTTVSTTGGAAPYTGTYTFDTNDFPNVSNTTPDTFWVYAVLEPAPADPTCRPFEEVRIIVDPLPTATAATITECETTAGGGDFEFTLADADTDVLNGQTLPMTLTYHDNQTDADNDSNPITTKTATDGTTVVVRVENAQGCYATAVVTLEIDTRPVFTLSLPDVCAGDDPIVAITLGAGADVSPTVSVNAGTGFGYATLSVGLLETSNGIIPAQNNTVTLTNTTGCDNSETIAVPAVTLKVCPPMFIGIDD